MRWLAFLLPLMVSAAVHAQAPAPQGAPAATPAREAEGAAPPAPPVAGKVEASQGKVSILDRERRSRAPKAGDPVYEGESIVTGAGGEVQVKMEDGGLIAVRPDTKLRIAEFRAEGEDTDRAVFGLLEGSFRSVTGWIAKLKGNRYQVRTPMATIGVRGTDHEPYHVPEGGRLVEPGTYDKVNQGGTYIETRQGRIEVAQGKSAFAHLKRAERPMLLASVPAIFRPGRFDARITRSYHEIQKRLPQQREERRKKHAEAREEHKDKAEERREHKEKQRERLEKERDAKRDAHKEHEPRKSHDERKPKDERKAKDERKPRVANKSDEARKAQKKREHKDRD